MSVNIIIQNERGTYLRALDKDKKPLYTERIINAKKFPTINRASLFIEVYKLRNLEVVEVTL